MNVLILTGKFGYGHYSVAKAIEEKIKLDDCSCNVEIIDFLSYMFPSVSKLIYRIFDFLVDKVSGVYNLLNRVSYKYSSVPLKRVVANRINDLLINKETDVVISVLPLCSQYISAYKKMYNSNIVLKTCITDIDVHSEWISSECDFYYVGSDKTKDYLLNIGIREDIIQVCGIPVRSQFKEFNSVHEKKNILIIGGGLGLIPSIDDFLYYLDGNNSINVTVITGNNKKLFDKLCYRYKNIKILSFVECVYDYMNEADLIITKAGGVTLFEAINSLTPMFILKPFLAQEVGNARFIEENNIGMVLWKNSANIYGDIVNLLSDEKRVSVMKESMRRIKNNLECVNFVGDL